MAELTRHKSESREYGPASASSLLILRYLSMALELRSCPTPLQDGSKMSVRDNTGQQAPLVLLLSTHFVRE